MAAPPDPNPIERRIAAICADILALDRVDVEDDLYDLGGDSRQAVLVALEIERVFAVSLPLEVMEETGSVRALAAWVADQRAAGGDPAGPADRA